MREDMTKAVETSAAAPEAGATDVDKPEIDKPEIALTDPEPAVVTAPVDKETESEASAQRSAAE
jgi:hypothetical protein